MILNRADIGSIALHHPPEERYKIGRLTHVVLATQELALLSGFLLYRVDKIDFQTYCLIVIINL